MLFLRLQRYEKIVPNARVAEKIIFTAMIRYKNLGGGSGVQAYETGPSHISVQFNGTPRIYTYSNRRAGMSHVNQMKILALRGYGLNSYINCFVRNLYD